MLPPFIALIGVWIFLSRQMQGGAGKAMGFGKSRAKLLTEKQGRVTFEDVAGIDEAKSELEEIVDEKVQAVVDDEEGLFSQIKALG